MMCQIMLAHQKQAVSFSGALVSFLAKKMTPCFSGLVSRLMQAVQLFCLSKPLGDEAGSLRIQVSVCTVQCSFSHTTLNGNGCCAWLAFGCWQLCHHVDNCCSYRNWALAIPWRILPVAAQHTCTMGAEHYCSFCASCMSHYSYSTGNLC